MSVSSRAGLSPRSSAARPALGARSWTTLIVLGLVGQIAWAVENMYLNVFVYDTLTGDPTVIATPGGGLRHRRDDRDHGRRHLV